MRVVSVLILIVLGSVATVFVMAKPATLDSATLLAATTTTAAAAAILFLFIGPSSRFSGLVRLLSRTRSPSEDLARRG